MSDLSWKSIPGKISRSLIFLFVLSVSYSRAESERVGTPWKGQAAIQESTQEIMAREKSTARRPAPIRRKPRSESDFQFLPQNPDSPDSSTPLTNAPSGGPTAESPQTLGVGFTGATLSETLAFPPDTMGAIGPSQYCVAVNGRIRTFDKNTGTADGVINADTDVFFNPVLTPPATNNYTSDPRIRYDRLSGKWFIIIIDVPGKSGLLPNRVLIAVSDGPVLTAATIWSFFYFQQDLVSPAGDTGNFADYPTLGIDAHALYIGVNVFGGRNGAFSNTTGFVVRKSSLLTAGPIIVTAFRKLIGKGPAGGPYTPQGVDNYDTNATEGYFIGVDGSYFGKLNLRRITNPGGTPSISANIQFTVPTTGGTIPVPHLGNTGGANGKLDGLDYRLIAAHIRNGRLWTSANIGVDNTGSPGGTDTRNGVRWYELQGIATGQTPSIYQSGTLFKSSPSNTTTEMSYWMGSIMVSGQGHAAMGFSAAGANDRINAATAGRLATDPLGTLQTPVLYTSTSASYNPPKDPGGAGGRRWGDYSYTSLDPSDDMTFWTIQEFCDAENSYGVRVVKLLAPPPATPTNSSPASLAQGATNLNLFIAGLVTNGSGFFDPGVGFSNRLSASVSGSGVTVQNVSYTNPSNIVLTVSVSSGATAGARSISVTNPDGQIATSASGILTITGGTTTTNHPPVLTLIVNQVVNELTLLTFTALATDSDADALTYSLDPGAPSGASIGATSGVFSWTPTEAQGPTVTNVTIRVTDNGSPALSDTQTFSVTVNEVNQAPLLNLISNQTVVEGTLLSFTAIASDADLPANVLTFSFATTPPTGATLNPTNGLFTWTPTEAQGPSTNTISIRVSDNGSPSLSATQTFFVTVLESNSPPVLASITNQIISAGELLTFTANASDLDIPTNSILFSLDSGAPSEAGINSTNGVFAWTPDASQIGTNTITVRATDDGSPPLSGAQTFSVVVVSLPILDIIRSETNVVISWQAIVGRTYRVQYKPEVTDAWSDLPGDITATGTVASKVDVIDASHRFYRLLLLP